MEKTANFHITPARTAEDLAITKNLFTIYAESLGFDLAFQSFEDELSGLPGKYATPHGELLLAYNSANGSELGCVAVRPLADNLSSKERKCCEMKRLYVSPDARGTGLGKALVDAIVEKAKELGYQEMRLDTLPSMQGAIRLYRRIGFIEIQPYYETPMEGTLFLALDLTKA